MLSHLQTRLAAVLLGLAALGACKDTTGSKPPGLPVLTSISPDTATLGRTGVTLTVTGTGFHSTSTVLWNGTALPTSFGSATALTATIPDAQLQSAGTANISVSTPPPGGGASAAVTFTIQNPVPVLTATSVDTTRVGRTGVVIGVTGTGFTPSSVVRWKGGGRATLYQSATQLSVTLADADLQTPGAAEITVYNDGPGGGSSAPRSITVYSPVPAVVLPSQGATAGRPGFTLMIHGGPFVSGAVVRWDGVERPAQFINANRLGVLLSSADVAAPGIHTVAVANPASGGAASAAASFTVRNVGAATATVTRIPIGGRDLVWDPGTNRIYVSVNSSGGRLHNMIAAVNPSTGAIVDSVFVGSNPGTLVRSHNGQYLYVGLNGSSSVRRVETAALSPGPSWSIGAGLVAGDIEVVPGQPLSVLVSKRNTCCSPSFEGVAVYDDGVQRGSSTPGHTGGIHIEFGETPNVVYGFNNQHTGFEFFTIAVDALGARNVTETSGLVSGFGTSLTSAHGIVYGSDGSVVDGARRVRLGTFPTGGRPAADPATGRVIFLTGSGFNVYDMNTYHLLGSVSIPNMAFPFGDLVRLVRVGTDGLAFLDTDELFIVRTPLVAP